MFTSKFKLFLFTSFFILLSSLSSKAQTTEFGAKVGLNFTDFFVDGPTNIGGVTSFTASGFARIPFIKELFFFQPELGYTRRGGRMWNNDAPHRLSMDFIEAPILVSIGKKNVSFVEVGGYFSYLLNSDLSNPNQVELAPSSFSTSDFNKLDYGIAFGLNFNYENYFVGARYYYGLQDLVTSANEEFFGRRLRTKSFQVYLMYSF